MILDQYREPMMKQPLSILLYVLLASAVLRSAGAGELQPDFGVSATFSIVAVDPETGTCGAAVASKYPAVGKVVPYVRAGVGAFCTQHWHNPDWGEKALDLLAAGHESEEVLGMLLKDDERRDQRQLAIIDMRGRAANRNPAEAGPSKIYWGAMSGRFYACQGNTLARREVIVAMASAYEETEGSLTDRLMAALVAADCQGGDHRGRLAAGIRIAKTGHEGHWFELYVDESEDAVIELLKKYVQTDHPAKGNWKQGEERFRHPCPQRKDVHLAAQNATDNVRVRAGVVEHEPKIVRQVVAVENVCAWPNLTLMRDGTVIAILHNQPAHGTQEGDIECWASPDGITWEKRSNVTRHAPNTVRMNHASGLTAGGDLVVLCSGWTNEEQSGRPKQPPFRDAVLRPWVLRSNDGGRTWQRREAFPEPQPGWTEFIPFGDIHAGNDGALHASCYQGKFDDPSQSFRTSSWRSWHFRSDDDGWTWKRGETIGPRHNETDILPLGGARWLAAARIDRMELLRSDDNGATWSQPVAVTDRNEINGHLARLRDGRLLLSYGVRVRDRRGVCAKLSRDDGKTWSRVWRLADAVGNADCGYPSSVQLADGSIVTAWYASESPQHSGYHMGATVWRAPAE